MAKPTAENIISQTEAAKLAGVSRQAIHDMLKKGMSQYNFFTPDGKVDISHADWQSYLSDRQDKSKSKKGVETEKEKEMKPTPVSGKDNKNPKSKPKPDRQESADDKKKWSADHALTGGYDPGMFYPGNPSQLKALTDIVAKNLEMRIKLGELIPRDMLDSYMDSISQCMQLFVEVGRIVSGTICNKLDRKGMEKDVEKIINPEIKKIIEQTISVCNKAKIKRVYNE